MQLLPRPSKNEANSQSAHAAGVTRYDAQEGMGYYPVNTGPEHERVVIFIDGSNLFYAAMQLGLEIDYTKLLKCLTGNRSLVRAYFYTGVDRSNEKQQGFLLWMRRNGYRVVAKELVQHPDGTKKANLDIEMAIDMMSLAGYCDTVVLLSGNGDLAYAVEKVAYKGVQIELVSLPSMLSDSLRNVVDRFVDLTMIQPLIQKVAKPKSSPPD
jgi:uncharacterized LabA/DUF88 family protein